MAEHDALPIGALAAAAGVHVETIRYYQRKGLLATPPRRPGEIRRYGHDQAARVSFIKAAQALGFSLDEVATLLTLDDGTRCGDARRLAEQRLETVRARLRDLRRMQAALTAVIAHCETARGTVACPLIAALQADAVGSPRGLTVGRPRDDVSAGSRRGRKRRFLR